MAAARALELVVLSGLQGSGKTWFYRQRLAATHRHVSKDLMRSARDRGARQRRMIEESAARGESVAVDNTNPAREDRVALVALARALGMRPVLYWFPPDVAASLARNAGREGKARVPDVAIFATKARLRAPDASEGFDAAFEVAADAAGGFTVRPMRLAPPAAPAP